jgi:hypothetical protein
LPSSSAIFASRSLLVVDAVDLRLVDAVDLLLVANIVVT